MLTHSSLLTGKFHRQRSLAGKEWETTEGLSTRSRAKHLRKLTVLSVLPAALRGTFYPTSTASSWLLPSAPTPAWWSWLCTATSWEAGG